MTINLLIIFKFSVIYSKMAINYAEKVLWNRPQIDVYFAAEHNKAFIDAKSTVKVVVWLTAENV